MKALDLNAVPLFSAVAKHQNFRRAALELGMAVSTLSERVRAFEDDIGVRLFNRTTRSVALTEAGYALLAEVVGPVASIQAAVASISGSGKQLSGRLRINGPSPALELRLGPLAAEFLSLHPSVRIDLIADDTLIDVVGAGFDAGVRYEENLAQDMVAITLGAPQRLVVVGSPDYLKRHGKPKHPRDLSEHSRLGQIFVNGNTLPWSFVRRGTRVSVMPNGPLFSTMSAVQLSAALAGQGLAYLFEEHCVGAINKHELEVVLEDWCPAFPAPFLYYPERRLMPAALRAFVDFIVARVRGHV